jgi:IMP dehydrogenase/GMP reductase
MNTSGSKRQIAFNEMLSSEKGKTDEMNNSFTMVNDIDLSGLSVKKAHDLQELIENKDKLILENSEKHYGILQNYEQLKSEYIVKQTELERTEDAYQTLLRDITVYKENHKKQHAELVARVRMTEESFKELGTHYVSLAEYTLCVYNTCIKSYSDLT